jgi:hypothetical protein
VGSTDKITFSRISRADTAAFDLPLEAEKAARRFSGGRPTEAILPETETILSLYPKKTYSEHHGRTQAAFRSKCPVGVVRFVGIAGVIAHAPSGDGR